MYCKNCGRQIQSGEICNECTSILNTTVVGNSEKFNVVEEVKTTNNNYSSSNYSNTNYTTNQNTTYNVQNQKSKIAAGLFGIFLGAFGVHNFYLGYTGKAIAQLLITVLSCGAFSFISVIWGFIEGILALCGDMKDANGNELKE